jgi:hypothetical protein
MTPMSVSTPTEASPMRTRRPSQVSTWMRLAPSITWRLVMMRPPSTTKPDPVPVPQALIERMRRTVSAARSSSVGSSAPPRMWGGGPGTQAVSRAQAPSATARAQRRRVTTRT